MPLSQLPPELLVQVYSSLDSLATALSLARSSSGLHGVWAAHRSTIVREVLPHDPRISLRPGLSLFGEAQALAHAQQHYELVSEGFPSPPWLLIKPYAGADVARGRRARDIPSHPS